MKKKPTQERIFACECGGRLRHAVLEKYDFSGYVGFPLTLVNVPGLRCDKCGGETVEGGVINTVLKKLAVEIAKIPRRLSADEARFLRPSLGVTQQKLARRMGVVRVTVAKWESGAEISSQHDLILRAVVLAPMIMHGHVPKGELAQLWPLFEAVRTLPPDESVPEDLREMDLSDLRIEGKARTRAA